MIDIMEYLEADHVFTEGDENVIREAVCEAMRAPELLSPPGLLSELERVELVAHLRNLLALLQRLLVAVTAQDETLPA